MSVLVVAPSHILLILLALFRLLTLLAYTAWEQKRRVHMDCSGVNTPYTPMIKWLLGG